MTQTPNIPPVIESEQSDYQDTGIVSTVAIAGHPLHPAIVTMPIGLLVTALGSDLVYWLTRDPFWARGSFWLLVAGLVTALVAAATGLMDFLKIERVRKRSAGWAHMALNVAATLLTVANIALRWGNVTGGVLPTGLLISVIVSALLGASGWYGGELVYRHKIAVIGFSDREHSH